MNYFAHGHAFTDCPWLLAGTAVPDWLSVVNRRVRARSKSARRFLHSRDQRVVLIAAGIVRHHADDDWFHRSRAFAELSWQFTVDIRDRLSADDGLRPSFLGHILVELLLDDELIRQDPGRLAAYYSAIDGLDYEFMAWVTCRITAGPAESLAQWIPRFSAERFLYDYRSDERLLFRLNMVMRRVGLAPLPGTICDWFPLARDMVRSRLGELMSPAASGCIDPS